MLHGLLVVLGNCGQVRVLTDVVGSKCHLLLAVLAASRSDCSSE